jgi:hypothetical protein
MYGIRSLAACNPAVYGRISAAWQLVKNLMVPQAVAEVFEKLVLLTGARTVGDMVLLNASLRVKD